MSSLAHSTVAPEGYIPIGLATGGAILVALSVGPLTSAPLIVLVALLLFVFRDPRRNVPPEALGILSSVDGTVMDVALAQDPFLKREALRVRVKMGLLDVHSIRVPSEGRIMQQWQSRSSASGRAQFANWVRTDEGDDIVWAVDLPPLSKPHFDMHTGNRVGQGHRCGYVFLGGYVDVYVPTSARPHVDVSDRVVAGETMLAQLVHAKPVVPATLRTARWWHGR